MSKRRSKKKSLQNKYLLQIKKDHYKLNRVCKPFVDIKNPVGSLKDVISNCSVKFKSIKDIKTIGKGGYGEVYSATLTTRTGKTKKLAVKKVEILDNHDFKEANKEIEFMDSMSKAKIGPTLDEAFIVEGMYVNQIIIMELFPYSVFDLFQNRKYIPRWKSIIQSMINLLKKQWFDYNLLCFDVKPENYVYNDKEKKVRMIDFGGDFCNLHKIQTINGKNRFTKKEYFGLALHILYINTETSLPLPPAFKKAVLSPFTKEKEFVKLLSDDELFDDILNENSKIADTYFHYYDHYYPETPENNSQRN